MRKIADLNPTQVRILGSLLEKEQTTPDSYPLTLNALVAACNQKSNREPVVRLESSGVLDELETLRGDVLVWRSDGGRVPHWSQSVSRRLELTDGEKAVLTVLMLRGPQTPGELRTRTQRLHPFETLGEVESTLAALAGAERDLVAELPRQPGQKENRWMQRLGGDEVPAAARVPAAPRPAVATAEASSGSTVDSRLDQLEGRVEQLTAEVQSLAENVSRLLADLGS